MSAYIAKTHNYEQYLESRVWKMKRKKDRQFLESVNFSRQNLAVSAVRDDSRRVIEQMRPSFVRQERALRELQFRYYLSATELFLDLSKKVTPYYALR